MATNDFLTFAGDPAADVLAQTQYIDPGFTARILGFSTGTAISTQLNKVWRQASLISSMIAQFTVDQTAQDMLDDGSPGGMAALETHFTSAIVHVAQGAVGTGYLPLIGGTLTGPLQINAANALQINAPGGAYASIGMVRQAGQAAQLAGYTGSTARWATLLADTAPEQGSNSGSNFDIISFNDAGTYLDTPLSINRATGVVNFSHNPTVNGGALPYVKTAGDTMTGTLGIGGLGVAFPGLGGFWGQHHLALGWDANAVVEVAVDGTWVGNIAMQGWVNGVVGGYLPLVGGTLSGPLTIHSNLVVDSTIWCRSTTYFSNLGDFSNFYDGRYRYRQWAGNWYDCWDGQTGTRTWAANGQWMSLDYSGSLSTSGSIRANGGRIISILGGASAVSAYNTAAGVCTGFWTDASGMWFGNCDGNGNPISAHVLCDNNGYVTLYANGQCNGNWWVGGQITGNSNMYIVGTTTLAGYVHCGGSGIQDDGPLTVNGTGFFVGVLTGNSDINANGNMHAGGGRIVSSGGNSPTVVSWTPGQAAMGFYTTNQMNFGHTDGAGNPNANPMMALADNGLFVVVPLYYPVSASSAKANIRPAAEFDSLAAICRTPIMAFDRLRGGRRVAHGLLADDLKQHLPDTITEDGQGDMAGLAFLDPTALIAHLFRAVQQLRAELKGSTDVRAA